MSLLCTRLLLCSRDASTSRRKVSRPVARRERIFGPHQRDRLRDASSEPTTGAVGGGYYLVPLWDPLACDETERWS